MIDFSKIAWEPRILRHPWGWDTASVRDKNVQAAIVYKGAINARRVMVEGHGIKVECPSLAAAAKIVNMADSQVRNYTSRGRDCHGYKITYLDPITPAPKKPVKVTDTVNGFVSEYPTLTAAAKILKCNTSTLGRRIGALYKNRYFIEAL